MRTGVVPVFYPDVPAAVFRSDGATLVAESAALDHIAESARTFPISMFWHREEPPEWYYSADELAEARPLWVEWFPASDGLVVTTDLLGAIGAGGEGVHLLGDVRQVVRELQELDTCLRVAYASGANFRLQLSQRPEGAEPPP
jgi:hypothetical protein